MNEWRERTWLTRHAVAAPFGIFAVALLLSVAEGGWAGWDTLSPIAEMVDLAAVIYAMLAVAFERGVNMVWWALEQKRKRAEKAREQGLKQGLEIGRAGLIAELKATGIPKTDRELDEWAKERGIPVDKAPRQ